MTTSGARGGANDAAPEVVEDGEEQAFDAEAHAAFFTELAERQAALDTARANRKEDPETYMQVQAEYGTWRRELRILGGRPLGDYSTWAPEVHAFAAANPDHPQVVAARNAERERLTAELAALGEA